MQFVVRQVSSIHEIILLPSHISSPPYIVRRGPLLNNRNESFESPQQRHNGPPSIQYLYTYIFLQRALLPPSFPPLQEREPPESQVTV